MGNGVFDASSKKDNGRQEDFTTEGAHDAEVGIEFGEGWMDCGLGLPDL